MRWFLLLPILLAGCAPLFAPQQQEVYIPCVVMTDHVGQEYIIDNVDEFIQSNITPNEAGRCFNRTAERITRWIDFDAATLLGKVTAVQGCRVDYDNSIEWNYVDQLVTYTIRPLVEGECAMTFISPNWILVEKIPPWYGVEFILETQP